MATSLTQMTREQRLKWLTGGQPQLSTNPGAYGSTRNAQGQSQTPTASGYTSPGGSPGQGSGTSSGSGANAGFNAAASATNAARMAAYRAALAQPHGLAQGYSVNPNINWDDKGADGKKMEHLETFDEQLSQLKGVLTLAKKWIAPKAPSLLTDNRIDPHNDRGGGAEQGDRQDSLSDRNSSNYSGAGRSNPTNRSSGVGKSGKKK